MSSVLTKADIFPIKGNTKYSYFLGTVKMTGFLIYSLFQNAFINEFVGISVR